MPCLQTAMVSFTEGKFSSMLLVGNHSEYCVGFASDFETNCLRFEVSSQGFFLPQIPIQKWHSTTVATF